MSLWVEAYRPKSLDQLVLLPHTKAFFADCIEKQEVPHLLLYGPPGTGKTTAARILTKALDAETLELNASDERGIDTIRDKVKMFFMVESFKPWKIIFFDEADALTSPAQFVLRNMMEKFSERSRIIFSVNFVEKVIEPIRSRFQAVQFEVVPIQAQYQLVRDILTAEHVEFDDDDIFKLAEDCQGDLRRILNEAQKLSKKQKLVYRTVRDLVDVHKLWEHLKNKKWTQVREMLAGGLDSQYVLKKLFDFVFEEISPEIAAEVVGEYLWRDSFVVDKPLNVLCACIELSKYVR